MRKKTAIAVCACGVLGLSLVACVPNVDQAIDQNGQVLGTASEEMPEVRTLEWSYDFAQRQAEEYAPEIITLEDGRQVQRTPDSKDNRAWHGLPTSYNTRVLDADNRGCESCHEEGLNAAVMNMTMFPHWDLDNGIGTNIEVDDCITCHDDHMRNLPNNESTSGQFGTVIHQIHSSDSFTGDCMDCHLATADGNGMQLWDLAKYDALSGIKSIADVQGDFSYDQDVIKGNSLGYTWWPSGSDQEEMSNALKGLDPDTSIYDTWTISVAGMVDNPFTMTLSEIIEEAPSETFISSVQCSINANSGEMLANAEVTGVPLTWFVEKAGVQEGAKSLVPTGRDGYNYYWDSLENLANQGGWLIYEVNGEPLSWLDGFPCRVWIPDEAAPCSIRWITDLTVTDDDPHYGRGIGIAGRPDNAPVWPGIPGTDYKMVNRPNFGICNTPEGLVLEAGKPYTFEGYADAMNEQIIAMEFSMDRGKTWTRFDTSDSDKQKWVYWYFTVQPEEPGAYVLSVRAVSDGGEEGERRTPVVDEVMVNFK